MNNNKKENFLRLSKSRLEKVNDALDTLGNCSNKSAYEYSEEEVSEIFREVEGKIREIKSKFKFEPTVVIPGEEEAKTWKQIAAGLKKHGETKAEFSKTQWGQNCVKFFIKDSPFWFTCYALHFKDPKKREYGIFISLPENNTDRSFDSLKSLIEQNKQRINDALPDVNTPSLEDEFFLAGWSRSRNEFSSDGAAIKWLEKTLDKFVQVFVPLINQIK